MTVPVDIKKLRQWIWDRWLHRGIQELAANEVLIAKLYSWCCQEFPKYFKRRDAGLTFNSEIQGKLEVIGRAAYLELLAHMVNGPWLTEIHRVLLQGEAREQKVIELTTQTETLKKKAEESNTQIAEASGIIAALKREAQREQEKARREQAKLESQVAASTEEKNALVQERDALKLELDATKAQVEGLTRERDDLRNKSRQPDLEKIASCLLYGQALEKAKAGDIVAEIVGAIKTVGQESEREFERLCDLQHAVIDESGLVPASGKGIDDLSEEDLQSFSLGVAKKLVAGWNEFRPARKAVKALQDDQKRVLAEDMAHFKEKSRPLFVERGGLLKTLGEVPAGFVESGALHYRDAWDTKLGDNAINEQSFDRLVEMLPRLRLNHKVASLRKLSKETGISRQTLKRYGDFVDLSRWLPAEQPQQEADAGKKQPG